jgi:hypothetical protein
VARTWFDQQRGQYEVAVPLVERALAAGVLLPAVWHYGNLVSMDEHRDLFVSILQTFMELGVPFDSISAYWLTLWNAGSQDAAVALFEAAAEPHPRSRRGELNDLLLAARDGANEIQTASAIVNERREEAITSIREHERAIEGERERVQRLVNDVTSLVQGKTADHMATAYAGFAGKALKAANWLTAAAITVAVIGAGWAGFVAYHAFQEDEGLQTTIGKVLVSLPILVIAGYIASVASSNRRMGWHWRHVELQIRTAEPFIGNLDQDTRDSLLAALAIRLFPGQAQDPQHGGASSERMDVGTLITGILHELKPRRGSTATGTTESSSAAATPPE